MGDRDARIVYSTGKGSMCPGCGWPLNDCKCSKQFAADEPVPARIVARLKMEKKGRGGKMVTVVYGLPRNEAFLKELSQGLKRACGTGGAVTDGGIELQGDLRNRVREALEKKGYVVEGLGAATASSGPRRSGPDVDGRLARGEQRREVLPPEGHSKGIAAAASGVSGMLSTATAGYVFHASYNAPDGPNERRRVSSSTAAAGPARQVGEHPAPVLELGPGQHRGPREQRMDRVWRTRIGQRPGTAALTLRAIALEAESVVPVGFDDATVAKASFPVAAPLADSPFEPRGVGGSS